MSEKKLSAPRNAVRVVGYLKENNLEEITNARGDKVIRGSIIVAVDEISSHKVQFYVASTTRKGEASKDFEELSALLPDNTVTIASFLKENPTADFKTASNAASKVWVMARFEEYASRLGERVRSMITLKGFRAGFKSATDKTPFDPAADFTVDVYVNALTDEEGTGRVILEGVMPIYNGSAYKINFVAPVEDNIASYIKANYGVGDTVTLKGDVISIQQRLVTEGESPTFFGRGEALQYETKFIRERRICGGSKDPIHQGEEGSFLTKNIKDALAVREVKMDENGARAAARTASVPSDSDMDF